MLLQIPISLNFRESWILLRYTGGDRAASSETGLGAVGSGIRGAGWNPWGSTERSKSNYAHCKLTGVQASQECSSKSIKHMPLCTKRPKKVAPLQATSAEFFSVK